MNVSYSPCSFILHFVSFSMDGWFLSKKINMSLNKRVTAVDVGDKPLPPLEAWLKNTSLCTIEECLKDVVSIFPDVLDDIGDFVSQRKKIVKSFNNAGGLTADEMVAIYIYTEEHLPRTTAAAAVCITNSTWPCEATSERTSNPI